MFYIVCTDKDSQEYVIRGIYKSGEVFWVLRLKADKDLGASFSNIFQAKDVINRERINDGKDSSYFSYKIVQKEE